MKFAFALFKYFPGGGLQNDMRSIAECAARHGHSVTVFSAQWSGPQPDGVKVEILPVSAHSNHARMLEFEQKFHALPLKEFDRTAAFSRISGCGWYFAADNCLAETFAREHWSLTLLLPRYRTLLAMERAVFAPESKTQILYLCERQKREFQKHYGTQDSRFHRIPPGIAEPFFHVDRVKARAAKRHELGISESDFMLMTAAANPKLKGADRVIRAVESLPPELRSKCRYFIAGTFPDSRSVSLGRRGDVPELLAAADLMVHPARNEAAGNVLLESIAVGTPVLCSAECGYAPFVAESGGIVLGSPFRQKELNSALERALRSPIAVRKPAPESLRGRPEAVLRLLEGE